MRWFLLLLLACLVPVTLAQAATSSDPAAGPIPQLLLDGSWQGAIVGCVALLTRAWGRSLDVLSAESRAWREAILLDRRGS